MNGSVGEMHAKKIARLYEMAMKAGAPVIGLIDCAGVRVQEAVDALAGFGEIYMSKVKASGVIPQISAILGSCGGGVAVSTLLSDFTFMEAENGKLFVNSPNAVDGNRVEACDTASAAFQAEAGQFQFTMNQSGSGDGYKRVLGEEKDGANAADIGFASRSFEGDEDVTKGLVTGQYCIDAVVAVVSKDNTNVDNLTAAQIKSIFTGETTSWADLK